MGFRGLGHNERRLTKILSLTYTTIMTNFQINYPPGSKSEALQLGVHLILLYFIRISLLSAETFFYPPGSKSEALQLGIHLILLYFIRISLSTPKTFFYLGGGWWMVGGVQLFYSLILLIIIWYLL